MFHGGSEMKTETIAAFGIGAILGALLLWLLKDYLPSAGGTRIQFVPVSPVSQTSSGFGLQGTERPCNVGGEQYMRPIPQQIMNQVSGF